ncbi:KISc [Seminavis robusta]|uniref:KISc n=1 Tax=Seminavis robusta TaxID=568900 RepID=A0A9N8HF83_9STRA|nr:KISc [Seminavis robusta]|eukprot:Sro423_g139730.1 KISc (475) ;mRNA; f:7167-8591
MWKSLLGNISPSVNLSTITAALNEPDDPILVPTEEEEFPHSTSAPSTNAPAPVHSTIDHSDGFFTPPKLPPSPRVVQRSNDSASDREIIAARIGLGSLRTKTPSRQNSSRNEPLMETQTRDCISLVETAKSGGIATLLIFEHSPAGKRHTLEAVLPVVTERIFSSLPVNHSVKVTIVELCGNLCVDLLDEESPSPVRVLDTDDGSVKYVGALSKVVATPEALFDDIVTAMGRTNGNFGGKGNSNNKDGGWFSRHLICRIVILPPPEAPSSIRKGTLTLLDCTGPSSKVDASMRVLKECLRASKYAGSTIGGNISSNNDNNGPPYSHSTVTRCLREGLREDATFHVIEADNPDQTAPTLKNTNSYESIFSDDSSSPTSGNTTPKVLPVPPRRWDNTSLCDWLVSRHLIDDRASVPRNLTGTVAMKMTKVELQMALYGNTDYKKADRLYRCLRSETDRVARLEVKKRMRCNRVQNE